MTKIEDSKHQGIIEEEVSRHLEDSEISKLSHFYAASVYEKRHKYYIGVPTTLAALLLSWFVAQKDFLVEYSSAIFGLKIVLSLIVAVSSGLSTFLNFNELASKHRKSALRYQKVWRECKNWSTDFPDSSDIKNAKLKVVTYRKEMTSINGDSPQIPKWAWKSVDKQKKEGSTKYENE